MRFTLEEKVAGVGLLVIGAQMFLLSSCAGAAPAHENPPVLVTPTAEPTKTPEPTPESLAAEETDLRAEIDKLTRRWKANVALAQALKGGRPAEEVQRRREEYERTR